MKNRLNSSPEYQSYRCWMIREGIDLVCFHLILMMMLISDGDKQVSYETSACRFLEWSDCSTAGCENYPGEKIKKKLSRSRNKKNYPGKKKTIRVKKKQNKKTIQVKKQENYPGQKIKRTIRVKKKLSR